MGGFSADWLALREPMDHASVSSVVRDAVRDAFARRPGVKVVDLGCGAGSNLRGLSPVLGQVQSWTLVDYDPALLAVARTRAEAAPPPGVVDLTFRQADLSGDALAEVIAGADLVTAAALFDLVSSTVIERLAAAVAAQRQAFATVLSYDGLAAWLPSNPADNAMRDVFNRHQQSDKGFGPAAGPGATDAIAAAFTQYGYRIVRGRSPWVVTAEHAELRRQVDAGWAAAVLETGLVPQSTVADWLAGREAAGAAAVTLVGHEDILCLPPDWRPDGPAARG